MRVKDFSMNFMFSMGINVLIKLSWFFIIDLKFQNIVGNSVYGRFLSIFNILYIGSCILDFGMAGYINSTIKNSKQISSQLVNNLFSIKLILSLIYGFFILILMMNTNNINERLVFLFLGISQILFWFNMLMRGVISGFHKFKIESIFGILDRGILILLFVLCLFFLKINIVYYAILQSISYFIVSVVLILYLIKNLEFNFKFQINKKVFKDLYKSCIYLFLYTLITSVVIKLDNLVLNYYFKNQSIVGEYGAIYRIIEAFQNFIMLISIILIPIYSDRDKSFEVKNRIKKISILFVVSMGILLSIISILWGDKILNLMYHQSNKEQYYSFIALSFGSIFLGLYIVYYSILIATQQYKDMLILSIFSLITSFFLNVFLSQRYLIIGSAISFLITFALFSISMIIYHESKYENKTTG